VHIPNYRCLIFRDTVPQLEGLISRSRELYTAAFPKARYNSNEKVWKFPSGASIFFGYMQREQDKFNYQGKAYDVIMFDELTHFTESMYDYLKSRNRPTGSGTRVYIRASCNPDGKGLGWVKNRFITPAPAGTTIWEEHDVYFPDGHVEKLKRDRVFIQSNIFDNKKLLENDPNYLATLAALPEAERNALLYGQWDSFTGQVFTEWRNDPTHYKDKKFTHVIEPFDIPMNWKIVRGFDFGYAKPFSVAWYAADPWGKIYRIKEYYGCKKDKPNVGLCINPYEIAAEIKKIESEDEMLKDRYITGVADPSIWDVSRGKSIADMMSDSPNFIYWTAGDNTRLAGKMQYHYRLAFDENGDTMFQVFNTCRDFIRTVPMLTYSDRHPEDIDTDMEDHIYDECRYVLMSNPIAPRENKLNKIELDDPLNLFPHKKTEYTYINV